MKSKRYIYLIARWGNEEEGPNGKDTMYLVIASSRDQATKLVDSELLKLPHQNVAPRSNWACLLGQADEGAMFNGIIKGPFYDMAALSGARLVWSREHTGKRWQVV